jgi:hypothetical protein
MNRPMYVKFTPFVYLFMTSFKSLANNERLNSTQMSTTPGTLCTFTQVTYTILLILLSEWSVDIKMLSAIVVVLIVGFFPQNLSTCLAACQNNEHYTDAAGNNVSHEDSSPPHFQAAKGPAKIDPGLI